jgi:hypothetical protein
MDMAFWSALSCPYFDANVVISSALLVLHISRHLSGLRNNHRAEFIQTDKTVSFSNPNYRANDQQLLYLEGKLSTKVGNFASTRPKSSTHVHHKASILHRSIRLRHRNAGRQ